MQIIDFLWQWFLLSMVLMWLSVPSSRPSKGPTVLEKITYTKFDDLLAADGLVNIFLAGLVILTWGNY